MIGKTIKAKIIIYSCALLLSVAVCQILFGAFFAKKYYTSVKMSEVESLFYDLKKNYSDDPGVIHGIIKNAENALNIYVQITSDSSGIGIAYLNDRLDLFALDSKSMAYVDEPKAQIIEVPEMLYSFLSQNATSEYIALSGKFEYNGDTRYVCITTSVESIDASVEVLTIVNTYISVFILIVGIICAIIFAKRFSKPVKDVQEVARNISVLNFNVRADENQGATELRDLSGSINAMADKLSCLVSDLQISNEKLRADVDYQMRLDKMRREFVANVSHELKTPLHLLLMYTENLKSNIENIDKDYYCNTIIEETLRLNDMVKSLLDLSAVENGLTKMCLSEISLSELSEYVVSKMSVLFENLTLNIDIEKEIFVSGDSGYIEQAIKNYIANAVSHTQIKKRIFIELKRDGDSAVFSVFNEGNPIADQDIDQIWESFYKTDKARARTDENHSGLGLYVVRAIIDTHGGSYGVSNVQDGVKFWFSLPLYKN